MKPSPRIAAVRFALPFVLVAGWSAPTMAAEVPAQNRNAMVVIGPERFHKPLAAFLEYRQAERPAEWASIESILRESNGVDDPERL
jgi:hypothetical protein